LDKKKQKAKQKSKQKSKYKTLEVLPPNHHEGFTLDRKGKLRFPRENIRYINGITDKKKQNAKQKIKISKQKSKYKTLEVSPPNHHEGFALDP